jgi:PAS domain S-box-containing protein
MVDFMSRGRRLTLLLVAPFVVSALVGVIAYEELHEADRFAALYNVAASRASVDASIDAGMLRAVADLRAFASSRTPQLLYDALQALTGAQMLVVPLHQAVHPSAALQAINAADRAQQAMLDLVQDACNHAFRALADPDPAAIVGVLDRLALYESRAAAARLAIAEQRMAEMSAAGLAARAAGQASASVELAAVAVLACLLVAAIVRGYRSLVRPIGRLASAASRWPAEALSPATGGHAASDVERLQFAFEAMRDSLDKQQRQLLQRQAALKQAGADSARTQERLSLALHGSRQSIWEWRVREDAFMVDARWWQIVGPADGSVGFKAHARRVHPADRQRHRHLLEDCLRGARDHFRADCRIRRPDGDWSWVETKGEVVERDARGHGTRIIGTLIDISRHKQREVELEQANGRLLGMVARVDDAVDGERRRLTRELHDELGQLLTGVQLDIGWIEAELGRVEAGPRWLPQGRAQLHDKLESMAQLTSRAMTVVRNVNTGARLPLHDGASLVGAMASLLEQFGQRTGVACTTSFEVVTELDHHRASSVFRVCQESLTNIARHAKASCVSVMFGRQRDELVLEVRDDGRGLADPQAAARPVGGLAGMHERALLLGGSLTVGSSAESGTTIRLAFPHAAAVRAELQPGS